MRATQTEKSNKTNPQSYTNVPDAYKAGPPAFGHYRQTPAGFGRWEGEWWLVSPFNREPWALANRKPREAEALPEGFEALFGPRPVWKDYNTYRARKQAVNAWEQDMENFIQAGQPPWAAEQALKTAANIFDAWGLGAPRYYEHKSYGWMAMFPDSAIEDYQMSAHTGIYTPHLLVTDYQIHMNDMGMSPTVIHPLLLGESMFGE